MVVESIRGPEQALHEVPVHITGRVDKALACQPEGLGNRGVALQQPGLSPFGNRAEERSSRRPGIEKDGARTPGVLRGMHTDLCCHAVHLHICDGALQRLPVQIQRTDVNAVVPQQFPDPILLPTVFAVAALEFGDKGKDILMITIQHEMDVVGHQDESQDTDIGAGRQDGDIVHPHLEIIIVPEPEEFRQMVR